MTIKFSCFSGRRVFNFSGWTPQHLEGWGGAQWTGTIACIGAKGARRRILTHVVHLKNVHDACMSTECCPCQELHTAGGEGVLMGK